ncbi:hypothetical protein [Streptomyces sp.]|uniref:hypothetical protein n=1 Tax=Streptomyces sp. TaxID=1931 RepID=UPI002810E1FE|nr:hypothetical protein [Streptomyces sp.]
MIVAAAGGLIGLETLLRATSACLAAVTLAGLASAAVLLWSQPSLRAGVAVSCVVIVAVLAFCGPFLLVPAVLAAAAVAYRLTDAAWTERTRASARDRAA